MATLLVLVLDDETDSSDILEAWENVKVPGVTMLDSSGSVHGHTDGRDNVPFVVSLRSVLEAQETPTHTFFTIIEKDAVVEQAVAAVLKIIPDFANGHHGIMFTVPVARVWGYSSSAP